MASRRRTAPAASLSVLLWLIMAVALVIPFVIAINSPLLEWRSPIYVMASLSGIIAMGLLLLQPMLVGGYLTGAGGLRGRRIHRWVGVLLLVAITIHVAGLWLTSPPDVVDALLFRSPTPFSVWGVIALYALLAAALLAAFRQRLLHNAALWRFGHSLSALIVTAGSVIHAVQVDGTMGLVSKWMLCLLAVATAVWVIFDLRSWSFLRRMRRKKA